MVDHAAAAGVDVRAAGAGDAVGVASGGAAAAGVATACTAGAAVAPADRVPALRTRLTLFQAWSRPGLSASADVRNASITLITFRDRDSARCSKVA